MAKATHNAEAARGMPGAQQWNLFTAHPHRQGISYVEHWRFAMGVAFRLLTSVLAFALHATLPFLRIAPRLDLEATAAFLTERNRWISSNGSSAALRLGATPIAECRSGVPSRHPGGVYFSTTNVSIG
jgi:hypothetical protein